MYTSTLLYMHMQNGYIAYFPLFPFILINMLFKYAITKLNLS